MDNNITNEVLDFYQETPTSRSMRPFLGSLTGGQSPRLAFRIHMIPQTSRSTRVR